MFFTHCMYLLVCRLALQYARMLKSAKRRLSSGGGSAKDDGPVTTLFEPWPVNPFNTTDLFR